MAKQRLKTPAQKQAAGTGALRPAPITTERVQRWFALLCDLGLDDFVESIMAAQARAVPAGRPVTAAEQAGAVETTPEGDARITINLGQIMRTFAKNNALLELAMILFEVDDEGAREVTISEINAAMGPFVRESNQLLGGLIGFGNAMA